MWQTLFSGGKRVSSARAYLHPAMKRPNLTVLTRALAKRVLVDGKKATGVEFTRGGKTVAATARREVILSGGAVNSPQLLQLSGIGNPELLQGLGIPVVAALNGVGDNLQDHYVITATWRLKPGTISVGATSVPADSCSSTHTAVPN